MTGLARSSCAVLRIKLLLAFPRSAWECRSGTLLRPERLPRTESVRFFYTMFGGVNDPRNPHTPHSQAHLQAFIRGVAEVCVTTQWCGARKKSVGFRFFNRSVKFFYTLRDQLNAH